jgi:hypothetical protein
MHRLHQVRGAPAHRLGGADGGAHRALDLARAARVGQQRLATRVAAHQLSLTTYRCKEPPLRAAVTQHA